MRSLLSLCSAICCLYAAGTMVEMQKEIEAQKIQLQSVQFNKGN